MKILVDTSVWSLVLRRKTKELTPAQKACAFVVRELIYRNQVLLIGPIRQEILSGIRDAGMFERLREYLRAFDESEIISNDYDEAAICANRCIAAGIASSAVDMLICAVAIRLDAPILTTDQDFVRYAS